MRDDAGPTDKASSAENRATERRCVIVGVPLLSQPQAERSIRHSAMMSRFHVATHLSWRFHAAVQIWIFVLFFYTAATEPDARLGHGASGDLVPEAVIDAEIAVMLSGSTES